MPCFASGGIDNDGDWAGPSFVRIFYWINRCDLEIEVTPEERAEEIANQLFMGKPPDLWTLTAQMLIVHHIREAEKDAYMRGKNETRGD